jgi:hypothetical protein
VVAELLEEASLLGGLRHPNIVWVYGLVLPVLSGGGQGAAAAAAGVPALLHRGVKRGGGGCLMPASLTLKQQPARPAAPATCRAVRPAD